MPARRPPPPPRRRQLSLGERLYDPATRGIVAQVVVLALLVWGIAAIIDNTIRNLEAQGIASGFDFLSRTAGFDISQTLIAYSNTMSYARAFWVGLLNTLLVAALGIVIATLVGFVVGIARLSHNFILSSLATIFVEVIRNIPPLLMLFAVYFGVLKNLPQPREGSIELPFGILLNIRGLFLPAPEWQAGSFLMAVGLAIGLATAIGLYVRARRVKIATGREPPILAPAIGLVIGLPIATGLALWAVTGPPVVFDMPTAGRFNVQGGVTVLPELVALLLGLSLYTAAFIAEIVRSGILGVPKGQREAARALGLSGGQTMRLVILPQALRIIIPPLTNQYLNLTKNSSLAVAIGYPDLVSVFAGTVLNQTNQAVEVILITMAVYLTLSLLTSLFMNWFNARMALVER